MFQAESKGATATEYGLVFGSYELNGFFVSSFVGKIVNILFHVLNSLHRIIESAPVSEGAEK